MSFAKLKDAAITVAVVLVGIYALNQVAVTRNVVQKALTGN